MSSIFDTDGAPTLGLNDCKVALWNGDGTYGTLVDVPSVQMMSPTIKVQSAQLEGDDAITATSSKIIGGEIKLRFGSISLAAAVVLFGFAKTASGSSATAQESMTFTSGAQLPIFGICGKALGAEKGGDLHVFLPKVRIMSDFVFGEMEYGKFSNTELTAYATGDDTFDLINFVEHHTVTAITFPPTGIS